jgi:hypothetical protein
MTTLQPAQFNVSTPTPNSLSQACPSTLTPQPEAIYVFAQTQAPGSSITLRLLSLRGVQNQGQYPIGASQQLQFTTLGSVDWGNGCLGIPQGNQIIMVPYPDMVVLIVDAIVGSWTIQLTPLGGMSATD